VSAHRGRVVLGAGHPLARLPGDRGHARRIPGRGATGCAGVVDASGQVIDTRGGVHAGLYVADGSMIPTGLGVNPSLTISAISLSVAGRIIAKLPPEPSASPTRVACVGRADAAIGGELRWKAREPQK
jgi:hypothetical protein